MLPGAESSLCMGCIMFSSAESECAPHMQHVMDRRQMGIGDMPMVNAVEHGVGMALATS